MATASVLSAFRTDLRLGCPCSSTLLVEPAASSTNVDGVGWLSGCAAAWHRRAGAAVARARQIHGPLRRLGDWSIMTAAGVSLWQRQRHTGRMAHERMTRNEKPEACVSRQTHLRSCRTPTLELAAAAHPSVKQLPESHVYCSPSLSRRVWLLISRQHVASRDKER